MNIVNEKVEHVKFGFGVITEEKNNKIWVQFQDEIKTKAFLYPDIFEVFLKAVNPTVEKDVLEELRRKQEQIELELEQIFSKKGLIPIAEIPYIRIRGACEHNLKSIDIDIPKNKLVVLTGISGSGKSSLAFDTIYADGQRRYMENWRRNFEGDRGKSPFPC